jgi:hypothetical protein
LPDNRRCGSGAVQRAGRVVFDDSRDASGSDKGERFWILGRDWIGVGGGSGENEKGELVSRCTWSIKDRRVLGRCHQISNPGLIQTALTSKKLNRL